MAHEVEKHEGQHRKPTRWRSRFRRLTLSGRTMFGMPADSARGSPAWRHQSPDHFDAASVDPELATKQLRTSIHMGGKIASANNPGCANRCPLRSTPDECGVAQGGGIVGRYLPLK